jgi:hypothetical protein
MSEKLDAMFGADAAEYIRQLQADMDIKLILLNQLAMMRWMMSTGMSTPDVKPILREQAQITQERLAHWGEKDEPHVLAKQSAPGH